MAGQPSCITCLPASVEAVAVIVDGTRPEVTFDGAAAGEPTVIAVGRRLHLLYPVTNREHPLIRVRVAADPDTELAGVLGLPGSLGTWAAVLRARRHLVPEGPVSPDGPVTIRYQIPGEAS
jgi:hypothetical protein